MKRKRKEKRRKKERKKSNVIQQCGKTSERKQRRKWPLRRKSKGENENEKKCLQKR